VCRGRNSILHFHNKRLERLIVQIFQLDFARPVLPDEIARLVLLDFGLSVGRSFADVLIGVKPEDGVERVLVQRHALAGG